MRKSTAGLSSVLLLAVLAGVCVAVFRIDSSLLSLRRQVSREGDLVFTLAPLAVRTGPVFESLATPNNYTTGAAFAGKLYLAGPGGLAVYDRVSGSADSSMDSSSNRPSNLLRTGLELPPAPIVALAEGRLRGQPSNLLLAATHGEGLLLFSSNSSAPVQQLRPTAAEDRDITSILPLASGDLLLGTRRAGLLLFDGKTLRLFGPGFAHVPITALAGDEGDFWVGSRAQGVLHWHAGQLDTLGPGNGLPDPQVDDIAIGPEGVFVATPLGVAQFSNGRFLRVLASGLFSRALALNSAGDSATLTIATIDQGLHTLSLNPRVAPVSLPNPATAWGAPFAARASGAMIGVAPTDRPTGNPLSVTHFFTAGRTLLAVAEGNLLRLGPAGDWQKILSAPPQSLADSNVTALSFGPGGRLWIGYFDRGIDVLDLQTGHAQHVEDDHVFCVNRIVPDLERHTMDVATANGLVLFDADPFEPAASDKPSAAEAGPRERQVLTRHDGLIADQVTDIAFSSAGMTAATPAGLTLFTASGPQSLYSFQGLANNHVYALSAGPGSSRILAGTLGGISILDHGTVLQNVTLRNSGLKRNWVTALARVSLPAPQPADDAAPGADAGSQSAQWFVGTYGGGVVAMDAAGHVTATDFPVPSAVINPNALLETPHRVFAGSLDNGLFVFNLASQRWSQILSGLPSPSVTALAENNGELYIGTENGIVRIAEAVLP